MKINGGLFGLRADYSVDSNLLETDVQALLGYLASRPLDDPTPIGDRIAIIVSGVSASEERTKAIILRACKQFENLKIFWLCFTESDVEAVRGLERKGLAQNLPMSPGIIVGDGNRMLCPIAHKDHAMLLLQVYQACAYSIPTSGLLFPGLWQMPNPPFITPAESLRENHAKAVEEVKEHICQQLRAQSKPRNIVTVTVTATSPGISSPRGAVSVLSGLFDTNWPGPVPGQSVWIELEQVARPAGFFIRLVQLTARQAGDPDPISSLDYRALENPADSFAPRFDAFHQSLMRTLRYYHARIGRRLVVMVNAQEGAGTYSPFEMESPDDAGNLWRAGTSQIENLVSICEEINSDESCGIQFVFAVRAYGEKISKKDDFLAQSCAKLHARLQSSAFTSAFQIKTVVSDCDLDKRAEKLSEWLKAPASEFETAELKKLNDQLPASDLRHLFVYLLTMYRHARFMAGILRTFGRLCAYLVSARRTAQRATIAAVGMESIVLLVQKWLEELEGIGAVWRKRGGLTWMHSGLRLDVQALIRDSGREPVLEIPWTEVLLEVVHLAARWQGRILLATADPLAAIESIRHSLNAVEWHTSGGPPEMEHPSLVAALRHALHILLMARPLIERRLADEFVFAALKNLTLYTESILSKKLGDPKIEEALVALGRELYLTRIAVCMREGEFEYIAPGGLVSREARRFVEDFAAVMENNKVDVGLLRLEIKMNEGGALVLLRKHVDFQSATGTHEGAQTLLNEVWNDLLVRTGLPTAQLPGTLLARKISLCQPSDQIRKLLVKTARWLLYLEMNRSQILYLSELQQNDERDGDFREKRKDGIEKALKYGEFGLELLRSCSPAGEFVYEENVRIRAHQSLLLAWLVAHDLLEGKFQTDGVTNVMRRPYTVIADARAFVEEYPYSASGTSVALVLLRSAEVKLLEVVSDERFRGFRRLIGKLGRACAERLRRHNDINSDYCANEREKILREIENPEYLFEIFDRFVVRTYDVLGLLNRARVELERHPKARWWWWILCVLTNRAGQCLKIARLAMLLAKSKAEAAKAKFSSKPGPAVLPSSLVRYMDTEVFIEVSTKRICDSFRLTRLALDVERAAYAEFFFRLFRGRQVLPKSSEALEGEELSKAIMVLVRTARKLGAIKIAAYASWQEGQDGNLRKYMDNAFGKMTDFLEWSANHVA